MSLLQVPGARARGGDGQSAGSSPSLDGRRLRTPPLCSGRGELVEGHGGQDPALAAEARCAGIQARGPRTALRRDAGKSANQSKRGAVASFGRPGWSGYSGGGG